MSKTMERVHFRVDPDGANELVRGFWSEKEYARAVDFLVNGFGMTLDQCFSVLRGEKKLVSEDGVRFDLEDDELVEYEPDIAKPEFGALLGRLKELEKKQEALDAAVEFACLVQCANGYDASD